MKSIEEYLDQRVKDAHIVFDYCRDVPDPPRNAHELQAHESIHYAKLILKLVNHIRSELDSGETFSAAQWLNWGTQFGHLDRLASPILMYEFDRKDWQRSLQKEISRSKRPGRRSYAKEVLFSAQARTWQEFVDFAGDEHDFEDEHIIATARKSEDGEIIRYHLLDYKNDRKSSLSPTSVASLVSKGNKT